MKKLFVMPYKSGSASAKALAGALGCKRIKLKNSTYRGNPDHLVVNWGSSKCEEFPNMLNKPSAVRVAANKLSALEALHAAGLSIPEFTTSPSLAAQWMAEGSTVVARTKIKSNSGKGIILLSDGDDVVPAPLYTKYINKTQEYRVHVFDGSAFDVQRKMRSRSVPDDQVNWKIRNLAGGFIFGREGVSLPDHALALCEKAVNTLGLDFGAVDLIFEQASNTYYVLEVNTACGLVGTTLEKYASAIRDYLEVN